MRFFATEGTEDTENSNILSSWVGLQPDTTVS